MTTSNAQSVSVIIPAGGSGLRFGGDVKKQFLTFGGESMLVHTIKVFLAHPQIQNVIVAVPADELEKQRAEFSAPRLQYVTAGTTRAESVRNGFQALKDARDDDVVLVHDAVRPLLTFKLIDRLIHAVIKTGTALPVVPLADTIKEVHGDHVIRTIDREKLRAAQTPQGVRFGLLREAYARAGENLTGATDEAMLLESCGHKVTVVEGERENIKITTAFDFVMAEAILQESGGSHSKRKKSK